MEPQTHGIIGTDYICYMFVGGKHFFIQYVELGKNA
jgi:hypothetical protein